MIEEDVIKAKRIELTDDNGDTRVVLHAAGGSETFDVGLGMLGPDGPRTGLTLGFHRGFPHLLLTDVSGSNISVSFNRDGTPTIRLRDAEGNEKIIGVE
jgi:hypothetical protein